MRSIGRMTGVKTGVLAACALLVGLAGPGAYAEDTHFKVYGGAGYVAPLSDGHTTLGSFRDNLKEEKQVGWNLGIEGRFTKLIGIEVDYLRAKQDVNFGGTVIGTTNFSPLTATLNFHVVHTNVVDFYVGPSYSYVNWGKIEINEAHRPFFSTVGLQTEGAHGWGAGMGLDIGIGKHFIITGGVRYLNVALEPTGSDSASVNPLIARLGVGARF